MPSGYKEMKQLITIENLDGCISTDGRCYIGKDQILSPGAKDELARRRVPLVYGDKPGSSCCSTKASACSTSGSSTSGSSCRKGGICDPDELAVAIAALLKKECGITDPGQLRALTIEALRRMARLS